MKWAASGFVAGFLLCYLLVSAFRSQPGAAGLLTRATPLAARSPMPPVVTNIPLPGVRIGSPDRWVDRMPGMPSIPRPLGYSLDLIDTRYQLPRMPEKP